VYNPSSDLEVGKSIVKINALQDMMPHDLADRYCYENLGCHKAVISLKTHFYFETVEVRKASHMGDKALGNSLQQKCIVVKI
jgi:hypothetical protein